jgi:hypothetical protein
VFENRVLRSVFVPRRDEGRGGWRTLHNEELHNIYSSSSIIRMSKLRRMRWAWHVAQMGAKRNAYRLFIGGKVRRKETTRKLMTYMGG